MDIFNPFVVEMSIDAPLRDVPLGNGNEVPLDFSGTPTLTVIGGSQVQVSTHTLYMYIIVNIDIVMLCH